MCSTALCFLLCFIFCSFKPASLWGSVARWIYCHTSSILYYPQIAWEHIPECCWMFRMFALEQGLLKYVALLQMLCSGVGHGFSIGKVGEAPIDLGVVKVWEGASLACRSICLHSQASGMPCLEPERRDFFWNSFASENEFSLWLELSLQEWFL